MTAPAPTEADSPETRYPEQPDFFRSPSKASLPPPSPQPSIVTTNPVYRERFNQLEALVKGGVLPWTNALSFEGVGRFHDLIGRVPELVQRGRNLTRRSRRWLEQVDQSCARSATCAACARPRHRAPTSPAWPGTGIWRMNPGNEVG
jgi:hypothetical protein